MPLVLVHGNPENTAVWSPLVAAVGREDVVRLAPPGFGGPVPPAWAATPDAYRDWLAAELKRLGEPADLVGHDLGGMHVALVAMTRPDLIRTWCTDALGAFVAGFRWHPLARTWQTRGPGERAAAQLAADPFGALTAAGVGSDVASALAGADVDAATMLAFYRAATEERLSALGRDLERARRRPGLVLTGADDRALGTREQRHRAAARAGAAVVELGGAGHWWLLENPAEAAAALRRVWADADRSTGRSATAPARR